MNFKLLRVLDPTLVGSLGKVQKIVLLCCGLVVAYKALPSCWRWATHFVYRGRLCDQELDSRDSAQRELVALVATTPPDAPYGLQILHPDPPNATVE